MGQGRWSGLLSLLVTAIVIGSLYVINGWDLPTYLGLALLALAFQQWHAHGRRFSRLFLLDLAVPALLLAALSYLAVSALLPGICFTFAGHRPGPLDRSLADRR